MPEKTLELLESLLGGHELTSRDLDDLASNQVPEDQYLDYKNAKLLDDKKKARIVIREYVSAFANSSGGILIIGIDQKNWEITNCKAPGGGDLAEWASRCLTPIHHYFSPLPQIKVVNHPNGQVLVIYTDRSLGLIPCIESNTQNYYFRLYDQTLPAPDYLIADLVLGKRQHPYLDATKIHFGNITFPDYDSHEIFLKFDVVFTLENESFVWAEDIRLGFIGFFSEPKREKYPLGRHLLSYIDVQKFENEMFQELCTLSHIIFATPKMEPFTVQTLSNYSKQFSLPIRRGFMWLGYSWKAAMYVISNQSPPLWYQIQLNINEDLRTALRNNTIISTENFLKVERLSAARPIVAWANFATS